MSVTKDWRISILILLIILSGALIWRPWQGLNPEIRGIQFGIDIKGGSRIYLKLEASHVTFKLDNVDKLGEIENILKDNQLPIIAYVTTYDNVTKQITVEIGRTVTKGMIENLIDNKAEVVSVDEAVSPSTIDEVMHLLSLRVDPYGTLGTQFTAVGLNLVRFEVALPLDKAIELLGRQGRLEIFIGDNLVLYGDDITDVGSVRLDVESNSYCVPFDLSQNGANKWASASANKVDYPTAIYLDRPTDDTLLLFDEGLLGGLQGITYDENRRMFYIPPETLGGTRVSSGIYLLVTSVKTNVNSLSPETLEFLQGQYGVKTKIILLGNRSDYSENILSTIENLGYPPPENFSRHTNESTIDWVERVCGLKSTPTITERVAGQPLSSMVITTGGNSDAARKRAEDLKVVLSQRLRVGISFESEESLDPRLGQEFMSQAVRALIAALLGVGLLVYLRYRHLKISAAIMGTMVSELVITLGMASAFGWTIGLPEIGGLIAIVGSGVDHQIIITDEVLRGALPHARRVGLTARIGRAFSIIFAAAATTIAAMVSLAYVGFGVMRGFAVITIAGVLLAVILTRPVYARVLGFIMEREKPEITE
jgi:preprotein translocase subunit SecD